MDEDWPPRGVSAPAFDTGDLRLIGWEVGRAAEDSEYPGALVLQTGRCPVHFAIILPRGASIRCLEDGTLTGDGAIFRGSGEVVHEDPACPCAGRSGA